MKAKKVVLIVISAITLCGGAWAYKTISEFDLKYGLRNAAITDYQVTDARHGGIREQDASVTEALVGPPATFETDDFIIHPPKESDNLQVFLISGKENVDGKSYETLSQAMENKHVTVHETGSVNELTISNTSDEYVFIHSGDIVKGGKQDRTISYDMIIPPHVEKQAIGSFCVESSRWRKRGNESTSSFSSNEKMISSKDLKMATRYDKNQSKVWEKVKEHKDKLSSGVYVKTGDATNVSNNASASSLQLALENKNLAKARKGATEMMKDLLTEVPDAIGYAYAINGEVYGVDVYGNNKLFSDLWGKILESVVVESIGELDTANHAKVTAEEVSIFMASIEADDPRETENKSLNTATSFKTSENGKKDVVFVTEDKEENKWVHKSHMRKE